jgi:hypothetical protein
MIEVRARLSGVTIISMHRVTISIISRHALHTLVACGPLNSQAFHRAAMLLFLPAITACFQPGTPANNSGDGSTGGSSSSTSLGVDPAGASSDMSGSHGVSSSSASASAGDTTVDESMTATGSSTGLAETGDDTTTGVAPCTGLGSAGLPGVNPNAIWIANSPQGTISKINTVTMIEEGRYLTRVDSGGDPSRTAVSLDGDVVVANRLGGLTKIHGAAEDCIDLDRDGVVTTSTDGEFLEWSEEECRAWHVPFSFSSQRPVAWTSGEFDEESCEWIDEKVWTAGVIDHSLIEVVLVDGETGIIEDSITIPEIAPNAGSPVDYGLYGGAVDSEGNFWAAMAHSGYLIKVDRGTLDHLVWPQPIASYGMTVSPSGHVFLCSGPHSLNEGVARFDPVTETWLLAPGVNGSGCVVDSQARLWLANDPVVAIDVMTLAVVQTIDVPEYLHGVGVDFNEKIWGVGFSFASTNAYRIDPDTGTFTLFGDLVAPYTYSDMTGFVLASVMR